MMIPAYVFDLDGTLADCSHRLHHIQKQPKDWDAFFADVGNDAPIPHMVSLLMHLRFGKRSTTAYDIVLVSGRSDQCRAQTNAWISRHLQMDNPPLFMRRAGDHRDDSIVKIEILANVRAAGFEPIMVFDDRDRVVAAWRAAGIPCAQVAPGDF